MVRPSRNYVEIKGRLSGVLSVRLVAKPITTFERSCATFARGRKVSRSISNNFSGALFFCYFFIKKKVEKNAYQSRDTELLNKNYFDDYSILIGMAS